MKTLIHNRTLIALSAVSCLALAGCLNNTTLGAPAYNSSAAQNTPSKTTQGAAIGALVGGIAGLSSDDDRGKKAVVGAVIGGAIGAGIGSQLDKQAEDLRADLGNNNVEIENTGSELIVTLPQDILFDSDSAVVRSGLQSDLQALASNLQDYPTTTVQVIGHTDNTGTAEYNQDLSSRRASAVTAILTANGVAYSRVQTFGRGENEPVTTNLTEEGKAQNRRVEIIITPAA